MSQPLSNSSSFSSSFSRPFDVVYCASPMTFGTKYKEGKDRKEYPMRKIIEGCWKAIISEKLRGKFYKLLATGEDKRLFPGVEVLDPYSRCNTAHHTQGRGLIFGKDKTPVSVHDVPPLSNAIPFVSSPMCLRVDLRFVLLSIPIHYSLVFSLRRTYWIFLGVLDCATTHVSTTCVHHLRTSSS